MADYAGYLPKMLFGEELDDALLVLPEYNDSFRSLEASERILRLMDIYKVFIPQAMAKEIYMKLYTMTVLSLKQKGTLDSVRQMDRIHQWGMGGEYKGVITGASSLSIIGDSGIGKTTCIQRAVELFGQVIEIEKPYRKIIPVVIVTTPFDCNYKGLLCQILISIDEALGTDYYSKTQKSSYNAQQILTMVCQLCHLHVGTLVIDEIQFLVEHKSGKQLYRMILTLINSSGISVVLVGTNECLDYFQQAPQMARRTAGLQYHNLPYGEEFLDLADTLFLYQYTRIRTDMSESIASWLYEHSAGNPATLMALIHDSQEIAIAKGIEKMGIGTLTEAYTKRMQMLHCYIEPQKTKLKSTSAKPSSAEITLEESNNQPISDATVSELAKKAKNDGTDIIMLYKTYFAIEELAI